MPSYPALNDRFPTCEAFLATLNSATFPLEGSGITVQAEHTSRKTSHGKKITVRCKLGRKKPGRKTGKSGSKNGDDDICPFRLVAKRDDASTSTGLGDFVVAEYLPHATPLHERWLFPGADADTDPVAPRETPSEASLRRDATGKFVARTRPPGILKEVNASQPVFVPEEPTVIDDVFYLRSGFAIPLLPSKRDSSRTAARIRPKRRSQRSLSHENDAKWHTWEARTSGEGERPVKRQRIMGAGGADTLRAWGWVRGLDEEAVDADEPESAAIVIDDDDGEGAGVGAELPLPEEAENAAVAAVKPAPSAKAQLPERGSSSQREAARFRDFWSRPDIVHLDSINLSTKPDQQPQTPFPPRSRDLSQSDEIDALSEAISLSFSFSLPPETPETSFSPTSPTLLRRREPQVAKSDLPATDAAAEEHRPTPTLVTIKQEELEDAREQLALEALLGLSGLPVGEYSAPLPISKTEKDRRALAHPAPNQDTSAIAVDHAVIHDVEQKVKDLPEARREATPPTRKRSPRKLSRWELPEPVEAEGLLVPEPTSAARDKQEDDEKPFDGASLSVGSSPSEPPSKPAALAFVPRSSKKPVASSRTTLKRQAYRADSVAASFSGPQSALMAVAQASKAKREADLLERARAEQSAAAVKAENEATEDEKLAEAVAREQRQAEDLKHLLWKSGGQNEGGKIDRLYSAAALEHRMTLLAQKAPSFCPSQELSAATTPLYLDLLSGPCRPARYRLPSLPAFPPRRIDSMSLSTASHDSKSLAGQLAGQCIQPDKRQLLALEYLYGRAVGVDECAHLEKHEPAMWRLVRVMAAVAEVNEWYRRVEQSVGARNRSAAGEADRDWKAGARRM